jgi:hypothetical protein
MAEQVRHIVDRDARTRSDVLLAMVHQVTGRPAPDSFWQALVD